MVAINEKAETYWVAVPGIEYAFMQKEELAERLKLGIEPDRERYSERMSQGYKMGF
jgi:hypothetical protein